MSSVSQKRRCSVSVLDGGIQRSARVLDAAPRRSGRHSFGQCLGWSLAESNRMKLETTTFSCVPSAGYTRRMSASPVV